MAGIRKLGAASRPGALLGCLLLVSAGAATAEEVTRLPGDSAAAKISNSIQATASSNAVADGISGIRRSMAVSTAPSMRTGADGVAALTGRSLRVTSSIRR